MSALRGGYRGGGGTFAPPDRFIRPPLLRERNPSAKQEKFLSK